MEFWKWFVFKWSLFF